MKKKILLIFTLCTIINISLTKAYSINNIILPASYHIKRHKLLDNIKNTLNINRSVTIYGTSGIGKTELSRQFAIQNKEKYEIIWFFDCSKDLKEQFFKLLTLINKKNKNKIYSKNNIIQNVLDYFLVNKNYLLIFDNLKINEQYKVFDLIEWQHNGHIIFSSQDAVNYPCPILIPTFSKKEEEKLIKKLVSVDEFNHLINNISPNFSQYPSYVKKFLIFFLNNKNLDEQDFKYFIENLDKKLDNNIKNILKTLDPNSIEMLYILFSMENKISKYFLKDIYNKDDFYKTFLNLYKYGLFSIDKRYNFIIINNKLKKHIISNIDNNIFKKSIETISNRLLFLLKNKPKIKKDFNFLNNFEQIIDYCDKYNIDDLNLLKLKKYLLKIYLHSGNSNSYNSIKWFFNNKKKLYYYNIKGHISEYIEFYIYANTISYQFQQNFIETEQNFSNINRLINNTDKNNTRLKFLFNLHKAKIYISENDLFEAKKYLNIANNLKDELVYFDIEDEVYFLSTISEFYLTKSDYDNALKFIDISINEIEKHKLLKDNFFMLYLKKVEILNYLKRFKQSYELAKSLHNQYKFIKNKTYHVSEQDKIIIELAKSELENNKINQALKHAKEAVSLYKNDCERNNQNLNYSKDPILAYAFTVLGFALDKNNEIKKSVEAYAKSEIIFFNKYKEKMYKIKYVNELYQKAVKTSVKLENKFWFNKFKNKLDKNYKYYYSGIQPTVTY